MTASLEHGNEYFPFAVNCRFSKTIIGIPKKCGYCQKMIVGTGFTCQNCNFRCHKRCVMISQGSQIYLRPKPCSLSRLSNGDCLASKIYKDNEMNSNENVFEFSRTDHKRNSNKSSKNEFDKTLENNENTIRKSEQNSKRRRHSRPFLTQNSFSITHSITSDDPCCSSSLQSASTTTSPSIISQPESPAFVDVKKGSYSRRNTAVSHLGITVTAHPSSRRASAAVISARLTTDSKRLNHGLIDRFLKIFPSLASMRHVDEKTPVAGNSKHATPVTGISNSAQHSSHSLHLEQTKDAQSKPLLQTKSNPGTHQLLTRTDGVRPIASRSICDLNSKLLTKLDDQKKRNGFVKTVPKLMMNGDTVINIDQKPMDNQLKKNHLNVYQTKPISFSPIIQKFRMRQENGRVQASGHKYLRNHESDPIKVVERKSAILSRDRRRRIASNANDFDVDQRLISTWPLAGYHLDYDEYDQLQLDASTDVLGIDKDVSNENAKNITRLSDLGEWTIPYADLVFIECVHECRNMTTYKGRWHGDVMIHTFDISDNENDQLWRQFLEKVRTLTKIRHENVALFMGASVEAPRLAVVTSIRKGCNLYEAAHMENRRLTLSVKLNIARQVAQGMAYLHAKGIILKTLSSKNIYLECKAKISMIDDGAPLKRHDHHTKGCVRRGHLTYISPELMKNMRVSPPELLFDGVFDKESDVYAFGTILYEMFSGEFPFSDLPPESIVWCIANGRREKLDNLQCNSTTKALIDDCWSSDPFYRPTFVEILKDLQHTAAANQKHSTSVPDKLNKAGLIRSPFNY